MSEPLYRIRPLQWKRFHQFDVEDGYILRAGGAGINFEILSLAYRRYLHHPHLGLPRNPAWTATWDERNYQGPTECRTIAECKAAADKLYRKQLRGDLIEHWMSIK